MLPSHIFFSSCTVIILCTLFAFIYIFSSFMHLLHSYLSLASVFFCPYSAHCSFFFPLFTLYRHIISFHILCILVHQLLICPSSHMSFSLALSTLLYFWVFFSPDSHSFHHFNVLLCPLLPYTSPPPSFTSFIVTISFFYASFIIISVPYFSQPSFPSTFLHIWRHIRLALLCNIGVNIFRFLYLAVSHNITSHLRRQICLHFFSFLGMCW